MSDKQVVLEPSLEIFTQKLQELFLEGYRLDPAHPACMAWNQHEVGVVREVAVPVKSVVQTSDDTADTDTKPQGAKRGPKSKSE